MNPGPCGDFVNGHRLRPGRPACSWGDGEDVCLLSFFANRVR